MNNTYNIHEHSECIVISFDDDTFSLKSFLNIFKGYPGSEKYHYESKASILFEKAAETEAKKSVKKENETYLEREERENAEKIEMKKRFEERKIINLENDSSFDEKKHVRIDNFVESLHKVYETSENWRTEEDFFLLHAMSKFLQLNITQSIYYREILRKNPRAFHYIFIVPSKWNREIKEEFIRPIFIDAGLILKEDHTDRLLFFTDVEIIYDHLHKHTYANIENISQIYKKDERSVLCRVVRSKEDELFISFDIILSTNPLINVHDAPLVPVVTRSTETFLSLGNFKDLLLTYLRKMLLSDAENNDLDESFEKVIHHILNHFSYKKTYWHDRITLHFREKLFQLDDMDCWEFNDEQKQIIASIGISDVCSALSEGVHKTIKDLVTNNLGRDHILVLVYLYRPYSSKEKIHLLIPWIEEILKFEKDTTKCSFVFAATAQETADHISLSDLMVEAVHKAAEMLKPLYANRMLIKPEDRLKNDDGSLKLKLPELKLDAIVYIDISFRSTLVSYSFPKEYATFSDNTGIPNLGMFLEVSDITALKVTDQGIQFMEKEFPDYIGYFSKYNLHIKKKPEPIKKDVEKNKENKNKKEPTKRDLACKCVFPDCEEIKLYEISQERREKLMSGIEETLHQRDQITVTHQQSYIRVFLLLYISYLRTIIEERLRLNKDEKIEVGYVMSIEKKLLDTVIGTKEDFKELIFASGIVPDNNHSQNLKIITQGEGLLPALIKYCRRNYNLELELPLRSYFLLANLHENYMQLTLNQVALSADSDKEPTAIVIQEEILPIQNMYHSLCMNIWNYIMEIGGFVEQCETHNGCDEFEFQNLFTLEIKEKLFKYMKEQISKNDFKESPPIDERSKISLSKFCKCAISLSMNDMIEIGLKPFLKSISTVMSISLENANLFGMYGNINYLFSLVHFNTDSTFRQYLSNLLTTELNGINIDRKIKTTCITISDYPNEFLTPFSQESFQIGDLQFVSSESYGFSVALLETGGYDTIIPSYKDQKTGAVAVPINKERAFPLIKKHERIDFSGTEKSFSLKKLSEYNSKKASEMGAVNGETEYGESVRISIFKIKNDDYFEREGGIPLDNIVWDELKDFELTGYRPDCDMSIIISVKPNGHSSSLSFSVKMVGQDIATKEEYSLDIKQPMLIASF